jgi:hypothetical protein
LGQQKPWSAPSAEQAEAAMEAARESLIIGQAWTLHKGTFPHRKEKSNVYAVWRVAKRCCSIENIGDIFVQC